MADILVPQQPVGIPINGENAIEVNGTPTLPAFVQRIIVGEVVGYDSEGNAIVIDVGSAASNVSTTEVNAAFVETPLLGVRNNRRSIKIVNDSAFAMLILFSAGVTLDHWAWKIPAGHGYETPLPVPGGVVSAIWVDPGGGVIAGKARVTEQW